MLAGDTPATTAISSIRSPSGSINRITSSPNRGDVLSAVTCCCFKRSSQYPIESGGIANAVASTWPVPRIPRRAPGHGKNVRIADIKIEIPLRIAGDRSDVMKSRDFAVHQAEDDV